MAEAAAKAKRPSNSLPIVYLLPPVAPPRITAWFRARETSRDVRGPLDSLDSKKTTAITSNDELFLLKLFLLKLFIHGTAGTTPQCLASISPSSAKDVRSGGYLVATGTLLSTVGSVRTQ